MESIKRLSKMHTSLNNQKQLTLYRPELRLYENLRHEIQNFVPPEESLRVEFTRMLAHPSLALNVIPEKFSDRLDSGGIPE